jgi:hypothetical protein
VSRDVLEYFAKSFTEKKPFFDMRGFPFRYISDGEVCIGMSALSRESFVQAGRWLEVIS